MSKKATFHFRLYVAGDAPNSLRAVANLRELCREHAPERHEIEIVDVIREPHRALADGVLLTPTVVRLSPGPPCRIVGNLSQRETVLATLGLIT